MSSFAGSVQIAEREITVDFPISKVKESIMYLFEKYPSKYPLRKNDINEVFNTYHFPVIELVNPAIIDLALENIEGVKTKIKMTVKNTSGSSSSNTTLSGVANDYLNVLSKVLVGESDDIISQAVKESKSTGCMILLLFGLASATLMSFILI